MLCAVAFDYFNDICAFLLFWPSNHATLFCYSRMLMISSTANHELPSVVISDLVVIKRCQAWLAWVELAVKVQHIWLFLRVKNPLATAHSSSTFSLIRVELSKICSSVARPYDTKNVYSSAKCAAQSNIIETEWYSISSNKQVKHTLLETFRSRNLNKCVSGKRDQCQPHISLQKAEHCYYY